MPSIPAEAIADAQLAENVYYPLGPFVSITLAQAIDESGWFKDMSGTFNCFGIKATNEQIAAGQATLCWTTETLNGVYVRLPQYFANYSSYKDAFLAHAQLLADSPYYVRCQQAATPQEYAVALEESGYATGIPG